MALTRVRYVPDRKGVGQLARSAVMGKVVRNAAERGARYAQSIAPVDTGQYRASFRVDTDVSGARMTATLANMAPYAVIVEVHHGKRVLGRAVDVIERGRG